jgi:hypothetical protein
MQRSVYLFDPLHCGGRAAGAHRPVYGILAALVGVLCSIRYVNFGERLFYVLRE